MLIKFLLNGKQINLTGDNTTITSSNFSVDKNGNMSCTNANVSGTVKANRGNVGDFKIVNNWLEIISNDGIKVQFNNHGIVMSLEQGSSSYSIGNFQGFTSNTIVNLLRADGGHSSLTVDEVTARQYNTLSVQEQKKDFEKFKQKAIDIIKNADIYKYRYTNEDEKIKKHIGMVIGKDYKYSKEITNQDNNSINLYSMCSVLWKAVQEQQEQIEELQKKDKEKDEIIKDLLKRIERLEGK